MPKKKLPARLRYDTDLTDAQWQVIAPMIPDACAGGRPRATSRELVEATLYFLRADVGWRLYALQPSISNLTRSALHRCPQAGEMLCRWRCLALGSFAGLQGPVRAPPKSIT